MADLHPSPPPRVDVASDSRSFENRGRWFIVSGRSLFNSLYGTGSPDLEEIFEAVPAVAYTCECQPR
ncbi:hypothetical protein N7468_007534 [Penicillium chermesinum]|uniref:Uncharacterized protein n=1 Tax=Penicillium chermesinum TaxID=63820 RepID=A0A9W9TKW9_9EURO|nr:uncharacterized protein N7468_007534 [Penicillium chermesinum]KAJ5226309.1 hypothetical protein N7468_007534 [Penicillium chermesinum]